MLKIKDKPKFTMVLNKKEWKYPSSFTLSQKELSNHVYAAARSGGCISQMR